MKKNEKTFSDQKINKIVTLVISTIYFILVSFGIVSMVQPDWLKKMSTVGQVSEAVTMQNYGDYFLNNQNYMMAIAQYNKAIAINPQMAEAYSNRGIAWKFLKEYNNAMADFEKALTFDNILHDATYYNIAEIYYELNKLDLALEYYIKSAECAPFPLLAYQKAGELLNNTEQWDLAFETFNKALENSFTLKNCFRGMLLRDFYLFSDTVVKNEIATLLETGINNIDLSTYDEKAFNDALTRNPHIASIYNQYGYAFGMTGNYEKAIECFNIALQIKPDFQNARNNLNAAWNMINNQPGQQQ
jgi:tetratricopeptide (TPR) repeat protein